MQSGRTLWFYFIYDWVTRKKEFFLGSGDDTHPDDPILPEDREYGPNESLYKCRLETPMDTRGEVGTELSVAVAHEEWETARKKPDKQSMVMWLAQQIFLMGHHLVPPHSFGPGNPFQASRDENKPVVRFQLGGKKYKITVSKDD